MGWKKDEKSRLTTKYLMFCLVFRFVLIIPYGHSSASYKLRISHGDIKSVQGDTGHASARTLTDTYAHTQTDDRIALRDTLEKDFYRKKKSVPTAAGKNPQDLGTEPMKKNIAVLLQMLEADPDFKKQLLAGLLANEGV